MTAPEPPFQILRADGSLADKSLEPDVPERDVVAMYQAMRIARLLDERCMILQRQGRIAFYGASTGEEAAVIGSAYALRSDDWIFPALRQSGALLMRGFSLEKYFLHMFGKAGSVEKGRSMPMHFSDRAENVVTWSSSMATQLPHAVGMAWAARHKGSDAIAMGYLGDGASSEGDFHAAMNFAGVWKAPVVFVCQNNQWAISVPFARQTASASVAAKAAAYGFDARRVDGNDVLACHAAARDAVAKARGGGGPTLIEAVTYRMLGHSSSDDPTRYRSADEVAAWAARDPLARCRRHLAAHGAWDDLREDALVADATARILDAIARAEAAPAPEPRTLVEDVFADVPWHLEREISDLDALRRGG